MRTDSVLDGCVGIGTRVAPGAEFDDTGKGGGEDPDFNAEFGWELGKEMEGWMKGCGPACFVEES